MICLKNHIYYNNLYKYLSFIKISKLINNVIYKKKIELKDKYLIHINLNKINYPNINYNLYNNSVKNNILTNYSIFNFSTKEKPQKKIKTHFIKIKNVIFSKNLLIFIPSSIIGLFIGKWIFNQLKKFYCYCYQRLTLPYYKYILLDKLVPTSKGVEKTLFINLNKTLIAYTYSLLNGLEVLKRPGLERFLSELSNLYEIVIFSNEDLNKIDEIINRLDPLKKYISNKIGKEGIRIYKGKYIKDLNYINRNLKNVIMLDYCLEDIPFHKDNTIIIPKFEGNGRDRELLFLIVFLKEMAKTNIKDIREEIKKWGNYKPYINFYKNNIKYSNLLPSSI